MALSTTYLSSAFNRSVRMKEMASLIGCSSRTSKYRSCPDVLSSGSLRLSEKGIRTLTGAMRTTRLPIQKRLLFLFFVPCPLDLREVVQRIQEVFVGLYRQCLQED